MPLKLEVVTLKGSSTCFCLASMFPFSRNLCTSLLCSAASQTHAGKIGDRTQLAWARPGGGRKPGGALRRLLAGAAMSRASCRHSDTRLDGGCNSVTDDWKEQRDVGEAAEEAGVDGRVDGREGAEAAGKKAASSHAPRPNIAVCCFSSWCNLSS